MIVSAGQQSTTRAAAERSEDHHGAVRPARLASETIGVQITFSEEVAVSGRHAWFLEIGENIRQPCGIERRRERRVSLRREA